MPRTRHQYQYLNTSSLRRRGEMNAVERILHYPSKKTRTWPQFFSIVDDVRYAINTALFWRFCFSKFRSFPTIKPRTTVFFGIGFICCRRQGHNHFSDHHISQSNMQGQEYSTINPDTFSDPDIWSYKDLQKLCGKLSLGGKGTRGALEDKLLSWHRERVYSDEPEQEKFEMNVPGNNFALLKIDVQNSKMSGKRARRKSSLLRIADSNACGIPPVTIPVSMPPVCGLTPSKSILKKRSASEDDYCEQSGAEQYLWSSTLTLGMTAEYTPKKMSKLTFSPFNGVKVISHRHEHLFAVQLFA